MPLGSWRIEPSRNSLPGNRLPQEALGLAREGDGIAHSQPLLRLSSHDTRSPTGLEAGSRGAVLRPRGRLPKGRLPWD